MDERRITETMMAAYGSYLKDEEKAVGTVENYLRHVRHFAVWLDGRAVTKETAAGWKEALLCEGYRPRSVNAMLTALNAFFAWAGWHDCRVKTLRLQRQLFREDSRELTQEEYGRLVAAAQELGRERLALLMETICATGIRVSEVKYITVEAAARGRAVVSLKGKIREIIIPGKLAKKLLRYARKNKTVSGGIFLTRNGNSMGRGQIWAAMKAVCKTAKVAPSKVFPHNLRHLFARTFYKSCRDVVKLADVLGHSSVETTRIYLISTGAEHRRQLERLGLVS